MFRNRLSAGLLAGAVILAGASLAVGTHPSAAQDKFAWPKYFNVITPSVGTANHSLAVAWTAEFSNMTGSRARVLPAPNGYARTEWLNSGEGRLSLYQPSDYFDQLDAVEGYASRIAGPSDTRMINMNLVTAWGYMVRGDSSIKTIEDIKKGTRVAFYKGSSFILAGMDAMLAYRGLTRDDVELVEIGSYGANTNVVVEGRADVTFTSPISGPSYQAEAAPNGIRWLELPEREKNPAAYDKYRAIQPGYIPQKTAAGVKSAIGLRMDHAYQANHVLAKDDPEFVYQLAKWMDVNHDKFKKKFNHAHMMSIDNLIAYLDAGALTPLHEGTIRYLKEKKLWKPAYQGRQDKLVELATKRVALYKEALETATDKGFSTVPGNKQWLALWEEVRKKNGHEKPFGLEVLALD
ncbi:MAG TPA: TAXI family TRAP transporter solute-binding subunit [Xanthobacteraceae bacterium]|nr:TAXI family TRAP transporter solute-binding subunit [Xanthobacteraceae bacterium]